MPWDVFTGTADGSSGLAASPRVLVADDDAAWRAGLCRYLRASGFDSMECADFATVANAVRPPANLFVIIAELTVGSRHLFDCLADFAHQPSAAVLVLSGQNDGTETIVALELGADDVIRKSTDRREILARIRAAARRLQTQAGAQTPPDTGSRVDAWRRDDAPPGNGAGVGAGWRFLPERHELTDPEGRPVLLTLLEFKMLEAFVANAGRPMHRRDLFTAVLERPYEDSDRSIDNLVARLRRKLGDPAKQARIIKTARPIGYVFTGLNAPSTRD